MSNNESEQPSNDHATIDRATSRRSRAFEKSDERLWTRDLERLLKLVTEHVDSLKRYKLANLDDSRSPSSRRDSAPNLSLAIFGPAGSGKSSLLKTLVFEAQRISRDTADSSFPKEIRSLDVLQPARFGESDRLLYATVAAGLVAYRNKQGNPYEFQPTTRVIEAYRELAPHLRVVFREKVPEDLEPHGLAAELIERHTSALVLRDRLGHFFDAVADALGDEESVVLLPVDDLDLSPEHLYEGLRELQAYLLHPRIIPVFCFTDRFAEEILGSALKDKVGGADQQRKQHGRLPVSEQLALQYLAKCFPVRNRIRLGPIPAKLQTASLRSDGGQGSSEADATPVLHGLIAASVLLFGISDREARHNVRASLRPSTLRRQFHVLDAMKQEKVDQLVGKWTGAQFSQKVKAKSSPKFEEHVSITFKRAAWALLNVHRDVLREYGLFIEDLYSWTPHALRRILLRSLFSSKGKSQIGLWQRWRNLTDSRRSQVISLLAANAHRPWIPGDRPSGEDRFELAGREDDLGSDEFPCGNHQLPPSLGLLWFLDVLIGFYLPMSRSIDRQILLKKDSSQEILTGSGWSFHNAPVRAALAADDDEVLFSTGMMFLDPLTYATALTTAPRIAACRMLDGYSPSKDEDWPEVKKYKVKFLQSSTRSTLEKAPESKPNNEEPMNVEGYVNEAGWKFAQTAAWESGKSHKQLGKFTKTGAPGVFTEHEKLKRCLEDHNYESAAECLECQPRPMDKECDSALEEIYRLNAAAQALHDDQLLLRIWTCYGFNRGRFWAMVSLWRGLGLIGRLLELSRHWKFGKKKCSTKMVKEIEGVLRNHSLRGLVPGKDLGGPTQPGMLRLAFPRWDSRDQRKAIRRLAFRLESWLRESRKVPCFDIFQVASGSDSKPSWAQCFVRRLHGESIVGSLWQWLDAEHLEHQGQQYSDRGSYLWNAGVALTSWMRVLLKYLRGVREIRWLLETCPLTSPFLSPSTSDPFSATLCEMPYWEVLKLVSEAPGTDREKGKKPDSVSRRRAKRFKVLAASLRKKWQKAPGDLANGETEKALIALLPASRKQKVASPGKSRLDGVLLGASRNEAGNVEHLVQQADRVHWSVLTYDKSGKTRTQKVRATLWKTKSERSRKAMAGALPGLDVAETGRGKREAKFELASLIQQRLKLVTHASTASLFYQVPRIRRRDFFSKRHPEDRS